MTPKRRKGHREHGRGSLVLDKRFPIVGRIKRASGTSDRKLYGMLVAMLDTLYNVGRIDLLRALRDGTLRPLEVWEHYRAGDLDRTPNPETLKPLRKTAIAWAKKYKGRRGEGIHERHRYELQKKLEALAALGPADATVAQLPTLLAAYRAIAVERGIHRTFNYARSAAQAFLRATYGRTSRIYREVGGIEPLAVTKRRQGNPRPVEAAITLRDRLPGPHGAHWWAMCCTGMGPDEYFGGKWTLQADRVEIRGTKRERRHRFTPRVATVQPAQTPYRPFREALKAATEGTVSPYDARRTFAHWLELAGIPRTRRKWYMGHTSGDVLSLYERHDVEAYLAEDGGKLAALLAGDRPALRVVRGGAA